MRTLTILILTLCVLNTSAQTTYPSGVTGCVARWNFSSIGGIIDSLADVSGNGHTGAVTNLAAASGFRSVTNTAMTFDGSTSFAQVPNNSQLTLQQFTIVALVKFNGFYSGLCNESQIICKGWPYWIPGQYGMGVGCNAYTGSCTVFSPTHEQLDFLDDETMITATPGNYISPDTWYFFAVTYDSVSIKMYQVVMDTSVYHTSISPLVTYSGYSHPVDSNSMDISIGKHLNPAYPYWFNGVMDELVLFNRALNPTELESVYTYLWGGIVVPENHPPHFTGGHEQSLSVCVNETDPVVPINSLLAVIDTDSGQTETWSVITPPSHGVVSASYVVTSTGGVLVPVGLTYTPASGYIGPDMFQVRVTDSIASDTTTINVNNSLEPNAGIISGPDSVCPGETINLSETVPSGIWSTSSFTISDINSSGLVMGLAPGADTIIYTVSNSCGVSSSLFPFAVLPYTTCHTRVNAISTPGNDFQIYPNPVNDDLNISSGNGISLVAITNPLGQTVYSHLWNSKQVQIGVADLPTGVYFIKINGTYVTKFVKQ